MDVGKLRVVLIRGCPNFLPSGCLQKLVETSRCTGEVKQVEGMKQLQDVEEELKREVEEFPQA